MCRGPWRLQVRAVASEALRNVVLQALAAAEVEALEVGAGREVLQGREAACFVKILTNFSKIC